MYLDGMLVLDIPRKATLAQVGETVVSRCFMGCHGQVRKRCSNRCCSDLDYVTKQATYGRRKTALIYR